MGRRGSHGAVVIRCDASPAIGAGHVTRCRALAGAIRDTGRAAVFAMREHLSTAFAAAVRDDGHRVEPLAPSAAEVEGTLAAMELAGTRAVVVDHYGIDSGDLERLRAAGCVVAVIDDRADRDLRSAHWLLNQNLAAPSLRYRASPDCVRLLGSAYALLRPQFADARSRLRRAFGDDDGNVLITFGGGDTVALVKTALEALARVERRLHVRVVLGAGSPRASALTQRVRETHHSVEVLRDVEAISEVMAWADLSLNAGGSTCWELMCLGVPMIVTSGSPDQRLNQRPLEEAGVAVAVGADRLGGVGPLVESLLSSSESRRRMSTRSMELIDGLGAGRAAASLVTTIDALLGEGQTP